MIPIKDNIPTDRFPVVTFVLILINVVAYLLAIRHGGSLISGPATPEIVKYGAIPRALTHPGVHCAAVAAVSDPQHSEMVCNNALLAANGIAPENPLPAWETVFTSMFMHASIIHIAGNMLFLWIFGNNVEDSMGPIKFICFYLLGGIAALALQVAVTSELDGAHRGRVGCDRGACSAATSCSIRARVC